MNQALTLSSSGTPERTVVTVAGEIDAHTAPELRTYLLDVVTAGASGLVLDLTGVTFLDSTALGVLIGTHRRVRALDGYLDLVTDHSLVLKVLRITALDRVFTIYPSLDKALETSVQR